MLTLPPSVRIHVALRPVDMRAQFDGLAGAVREYIGGDPLSGHLFMFFNRRRTIVKALTCLEIAHDHDHGRADDPPRS